MTLPGKSKGEVLKRQKNGLAEIARTSPIKAWHLHDNDHDHYEVGLEPASRHAGKNCAVIKSLTNNESDEDARNASCHLTQVCGVDDFRGKRLRMTAWVKAELSARALGRLELCIIGKWGWYCKWNGTFDNMHDRQITGSSDWQQHALVVDVPEESTSMSFGVFMIGMGKMWIDEFSFEVVDKNTPLTGLGSKPVNLNFQD